MGSRNSIPASSAICASFRLFSQEASQRSGTFVTAMPPEQFGEKMPSLSLLPLNIVVRWFSRVPDMISPHSKISSRHEIETLDYKGSIVENETPLLDYNRCLCHWRQATNGDDAVTSAGRVN